MTNWSITLFLLGALAFGIWLLNLACQARAKNMLGVSLIMLIFGLAVCFASGFATVMLWTT